MVAWLVYYVGWIPGQTFDATRFIFFDQGSFLYAIGRMVAGERLYSEFAWQYGPLALAWYGFFAAIGGNTPLTLVVASGLATGLAWAGLVLLAARKVGPLAAWLCGVLGLLPALTAPCLLSINHGPHGAIEALIMMIIAWLLAGDRPALGRAFGLGLAIGALQLVRFGPHLVAGLLAPALWLARSWPGWPVGKRRWKVVQLLAVILAGYVTVVMPFAGWLSLRLPWVAVWEQLWPSYMTAVYREVYMTRWPEIDSWADFAKRWLPFLVPGVMSLVITGRLVRNRVRLDGPQSALLFLFLYFAVGCVVLFRSPPGVLAHCWLAWPAVVLVVEVRSAWWRGLALAVVLPAFIFNLRDWIQTWRVERTWQAQPMLLPNGQRLWFHGSEPARFGALARLLQEKPSPLPPGTRRKLVVLGAGGGFQHFFDTARVGRHWWYIVRFVRPWEMSQVADDIAQHELLLQAVFYQDPGSRMHADKVGLELPLDPQFARPLLDRLEFVEWVPGVGYVFQITPK